jgi:hypothetical protein
MDKIPFPFDGTSIAAHRQENVGKALGNAALERRAEVWYNVAAAERHSSSLQHAVKASRLESLPGTLRSCSAIIQRPSHQVYRGILFREEMLWPV